MKYSYIANITLLCFFVIISNSYAQLNNNSNKSQKAGYCMSYAVSPDDGDIFNVTFGTLNNSSDCSSVGGAGSYINQYSNYKALTPPDIPRNMSIPFSVQIGTCGGNYNNAIKVYIDYNQNLNFTDPGENVYASTAQTNGPHTESGNIMIPLTAVLGNTVMRVVNATNSISFITSCTSNNFGETEDYTINIVPCPCLSPTNLSATNIQLFQADISWDEATLTNQWQYEWGIQGFILGTGTRDTTTHKPYTLTGLIDGTSYDFYVRSVCCAGDDTSSWAGPYTFTTTCGTYNIPYSQNFDGVTAPLLPACWSVTNDNADTYYWKTNTSYAHSAPNSMYIRYNPFLNMDDWFFTPKLHFESGKYYKVDFWYSSLGTYYTEKLEVKWGTSASAAGMIEGNIFDDPNVISDYKPGSGIIAPSTTADYYVGFHGYSIADMDYLAVDDISIKEVPYADILISQNNVINCDTLGWFNLSITIKNVGQDTVKTGDTISCTYTIDPGTPVTEKIVASANILPEDSTTFIFLTQFHFNSFTTYNVVYTALWIKDMSAANNTKAYTITAITPPVVNLGEDLTICDDQSILLDAGNPGATYHWWNGSTASNYLIDVSYCGSGSTCNYSVTVTKDECSAADTIAVTFDACTGMIENISASFDIVPNPNNGLITIQLNGITGKIQLRVISIEGQLFYSEEFENTVALFEKRIDLSYLPKGVYMLNIMNGELSIFKKLIIE